MSRIASLGTFAMDIEKLPRDTRRIWERLRQEPLLNGFILIGGTALTLRIGHRISEDLDFACLGRLLPKQRISLLVQRLRTEGIALESHQDVAAEQDFIKAGLLLEDHQQNHIVRLPDGGAVKVSFVRLDNGVTALLSGSIDSPLRVATIDEIFKTKAVVCAERSKSRDWFDLHTLMTRYGFDAEDFHRAFEEADCASSFDIACMRLRACTPGAADEGYEHLLEFAPSIAEMRSFFNQVLDRLEVDLSAAAFRLAQARIKPRSS